MGQRIKHLKEMKIELGDFFALVGPEEVDSEFRCFLKRQDRPHHAMWAIGAFKEFHPSNDKVVRCLAPTVLYLLPPLHMADGRLPRIITEPISALGGISLPAQSPEIYVGMTDIVNGLERDETMRVYSPLFRELWHIH